MLGAQWGPFPMRLCCHTYTGVVFMRVRTGGAHLKGVGARKRDYAVRQRKGTRKISAWLQQMHRMYISLFSFKVGITKSLVETAHKGIGCSTVRIELWRARIRTGCYQVDGQTLAACILIKEAHFFRV